MKIGEVGLRKGIIVGGEDNWKEFSSCCSWRALSRDSKDCYLGNLVGLLCLRLSKVRFIVFALCPNRRIEVFGRFLVK